MGLALLTGRPLQFGPHLAQASRLWRPGGEGAGLGSSASLGPLVPWSPGPFLFLILTCCLALPTSAAEIYTNGVGGGRWSDPVTWRGGAPPAPGDIAVIAARDTAVFDLKDSEGATCAELAIDPGGVLSFPPGPEALRLIVAGPIETYGAIRIDATDPATGTREIRLVALEAEGRVIRIGRRGALLLYGAARRPNEQPSVLLTTGGPGEDGTRRSGLLEARDESMLELQHVGIEDLHVTAAALDNTGFESHERINLVGNRFTGLSHVTINSCDTPHVIDNTFDYDGEVLLQQTALFVASSPLALIRGNRIRGAYIMGLQGRAMADGTVESNTVEGCTTGMYWYGTNAMMRKNRISACDLGLLVTSMSGALDDIVFADTARGLHVAGATVQASNLRTEELRENGVPIEVVTGHVTLINCPIRPEQIKLEKQPKPEERSIRASQYLVVKVAGSVPEGTQVTVAPQGVAEPDPAKEAALVRNSPAPVLPNGLTPLPATLRPLVVQTWSMDAQGNVTAAPQYRISVLGPVTKEGAQRPVLAEKTVEPDASWYRQDPDAPQATVEIALP